MRHLTASLARSATQRAEQGARHREDRKIAARIPDERSKNRQSPKATDMGPVPPATVATVAEEFPAVSPKPGREEGDVGGLGMKAILPSGPITGTSTEPAFPLLRDDGVQSGTPVAQMKEPSAPPTQPKPEVKELASPPSQPKPEVEEAAAEKLASRPRIGRPPSLNSAETATYPTIPELPIPKSEARAVSEQPQHEPISVAKPGNDDLWQEPVSLLEQFSALAGVEDTASWATEVKQAVHNLGMAASEGAKEVPSLLNQLADLRHGAEPLAGRLSSARLAADVRRAGFALGRRLEIWQQMEAIGGLRSTESDAVPADPHRLSLCLSEVGTIVHSSPEGEAWDKYLALDTLGELTHQRAAANDQRSRLLARSVLDRLTRVPMNQHQRRFLSRGPWVALRSELRAWATEPVRTAGLLRHVEQYERTGAPADARLVAQDCQRLAMSPTVARRQISRSLETWYRNANVRLVVSSELLNRLVPPRAPEYADVDEVMLGTRVVGQSRTDSDVNLRLVPDANRLHLALEVQGQVAALTRSTAGPATFYNDSQSVYRAWKEVEIGREGLVLQPAQVSVDNDVRLRSVSTSFDGIPLVSALAKEVARSQHESKRCEMNSETEERVYSRAKHQIDVETDARLTGLAKQIQTHMMEPLTDLGLGPTLVSAETTAHRVAMRLRLASDEQLGAHTPRPMAPADSLASFQIHESALNNIVEQLGLNGTKFTVSELRRRISERFHQPLAAEGEGDHDDVTIAFAPQNAVQVRCRNGQVGIVLAVAKVTKGTDAWENFEVRAFYRPKLNDHSVELAREDVVQLIGQQLSTRSQIALRGIFSKAFSNKRPISILPDKVARDPRLAGLGVTQLVLEDGWLSLALGHERVAAKQAAQQLQ